MSRYAYQRALRMRLIERDTDEKRFLEAIHSYLGCSGRDVEICDYLTQNMKDEDFRRLIEAVKRRMKKEVEIAGVM